ncbi:MAG: aminoglycoside phosphotransferase family protein [Blastocatellia bacterium]
MQRVEELARNWGVVVERRLETQTSFIAFGMRGNQPVVVKVLRRPGDEWRCGAVLEAFDGNGIVRVYQHVEGAVLLERLDPGTQLADMALNGRDEEATDIVVEVMQKMSRPRESKAFATVEVWGKGFERYLASGDNQVPISLVERGQQIYSKLCSSQKGTRLLHGDLQHYNILFDSARGWLSIDPKGVVGEIEYEIGASLRNPYERPELFASTRTIERRVKRYEEKLKLNSGRALAWGFAQSVLSAIWSVEDGYAVDARDPSLILASAIWPMLD